MAGAGRPVARRLIGRSEELERLSRAAAGAGRGQGWCVLIAGEAGIGKTRLLAELRSRFSGTVFVGRCYEEDAAFPFAPLQGGLRGLLAAAGPSGSPLVEQYGNALGRLLPDYAGLGEAPASAPEVADPATRQRDLFTALAGLLFDFAARQPLLVILEDLHWSDESTLAFLRYLARRLEHHAVLLAATYRTGEAPVQLADLLAMLERERLAERLTLKPLARTELDALLHSLFDTEHSVSSDLLDAVAAFSAGNPLYVQELVASMIQAGELYEQDGVWTRKATRELRVPDSLQEAVRRRTSALTGQAYGVLTLAAIAGPEVAFELLATIAGLPEKELVGALKELVAAGILAEERADTFVFRHPLLREAVQAQMLARERRAIHRQVAEALEQLYGEGTAAHAAELAYHYYEAGAWEQALPLAQRAGEQAQALDATREALSQYSRALDCAQRLRVKAPLGLLLARAELYERAGEFEGAEADLSAALEQAEHAGRQHETWQALLKLGYLWSARDYGRSLGWYERALDAAEALGDPLARAETLNRIGNVYLNRDQPHRALPYHEAALAAFESAGDGTAQANTLELMAVCYYNLPDVLAGAGCEERALALARSAGARSVVFHASIHLLLPLRFETEVGPRVDVQRLANLGEEALRLARSMGWPGGEAQALGLLGGFYGLLGEYDRALAYLADSLRLAEQLEHVAGIAASERMIAAVLLELMAYDEAAERLRRARALAIEAGAGLFGDIAALALGETLAARGRAEDLAEAEELLTGLMTGANKAGGRIEREAVGVRAELELAKGNAAGALALLEELIASTRHLEDHGLAAVPRLALLLGRTFTALGRAPEAEEALQAALKGAAAQSRKGLLWRGHASLGGLRLRAKQRRAAQDDFEQARKLIRELSTDISDRALRDTFVRKALATMPLPRPPTLRRIQMLTHYGLTERERSVATLVAQGRSNREIAETLVISERTAERHVANILAKLGLASRVQLAAWVTENLPSR